MLKHRREVVPLYSGSGKSSINILIADEAGWDKALALINKNNDVKDKLYEFEEVKAFCTMTEKNGVNHFWMLFKSTNLDLNTISHEIVHAVNYIYISRCMRLDASNDEPQAYLTGWITEITTKFLKSYIKI